MKLARSCLNRFILQLGKVTEFRSLSCSAINEMRVLNVAEKNDAAKGIADLLSNGHFRRREGLSKFNKIYDFEYRILGQQATMVMTSVSGHMMEMKFNGNYSSWKSVNPVVLFSAPIVKTCSPDSENIKKTLLREIMQCNTLIIWTDCDREGENIGFEIIDVCKSVKPNLSVYRAKFSEITAQSVARACQNLGQPDANVNNAVDVRQELDLRIGAAFTRFQTLRLQRVFPNDLAQQLISYGSCQFPTLGFVVERYKAAQAFIPEPFWKIQVLHKKDEVTTEFLWQRVRLFNELACLVRFKMCTDNPTATVLDVKSKPKKKWRPLPLDTVEYEKLASRKLHINAKQAMGVAEKLYTKGFISYPRTETNIFPKEMNLAELVQHQVGDPNWGGFAERVLHDGPNPRQGNKSDKAHPPIHPIKYTDGLQGNESRLYELIVRHFLACLSKDAEGHETTVDLEIAKEMFYAKGLMILAKNYLEVYPYDHWSDKVMGHYTIGEQFIPSEINMNSGETTAPPLLTEADLIALMEKHGIGTDATHADHIETIKQRLYVGLQNNFFIPAVLGMGLVEGYDSMGFFMSKPHLRAELEADLKRICDGTKDPTVVLQEQIEQYKDVFIKASEQVKKLDDAVGNYYGVVAEAVPVEALEVPALPTPVMKCKSCGFDMVLRETKDGNKYYIGCVSFPACKKSIWLPASFTNVQVDDTVCDQCTPGPIRKLKFTFKRGYEPPGYENVHVGCIGGCDAYFNEALDIRLPLTTNNTTNTLTQSSRMYHNGDGAGTVPRTTYVQPTMDPPQNYGQAINEGETPNCNCGEPAMRLITRKEGPNQGRPFFKCAKRDGQCNYFQWEDSIPIANENVNKRPRLGNETAPANMTCNCGRPVKRVKTVNGMNAGREFFACAHPRDQQCNFFKWVDEVAPLNQQQHTFGAGRGEKIGTAGRGRGRGQGRGNPIGGGDVRMQGASTSGRSQKTKCSICHQEGHNKRSCPNKQ